MKTSRLYKIGFWLMFMSAYVLYLFKQLTFENLVVVGLVLLTNMLMFVGENK